MSATSQSPSSSRPVFEFDLSIRVDDVPELFAAARERALKERYPPAHADELLKWPDGEVNIGACLVMLLDPGSLPGCSVIGSAAQAVNAPALEQDSEAPDGPTP